MLISFRRGLVGAATITLWKHTVKWVVILWVLGMAVLCRIHVQHGPGLRTDLFCFPHQFPIQWPHH